MKKMVMMCAVALAAIGAMADITLSDVQVFSGFPWKDVIIGYRITGAVNGSCNLIVAATNNVTKAGCVCQSLEGVSLEEGWHSIKWLAQQDGFCVDSDDVTFTLKLFSFVPASEIGFDDLTVTTGGNAKWSLTGDVKRSGSIGDSQTTWMQTTITGPVEVHFDWKVSSESGWDWARFYDGNNELVKKSGTGYDWEPKTFSIAAGNHTLKWQYSKDGSALRGDDCVYVRNVRIVYPERETVFSEVKVDACSVDTTFRDWTDVGNLMGIAYGTVNTNVKNIVYADNNRFVSSYERGQKEWTSTHDGNHLFEWSSGGLSMSSIAVVTPTLYKGKCIDGVGQIPVGTKKIGASAFSGCSDMTSVTIPASVDEIGENAFSGCTNLKRVNVGSLQDWLKIKFVNRTANPLNGGAQLYVADVLVSDLVIPEGVVEVGECAFAGGGFKSVTLPESLTKVQPTSFVGCQSLTNVNLNCELLKQETVSVKYPVKTGSSSWTEMSERHLGDKVYRSNAIGDYGSTGISFATPLGIRELNFSWKVGSEQNYDWLSWYLDGNLQSRISGQRDWETVSRKLDGAEHTIRFVYSKDYSGSSSPDCGFVSVHGSKFGGHSLVEIFPNSPISSVRLVGAIDEIPASFFSECTMLARVELPDTVKSFGDYAFCGCSKLEVITIPAGVTNFGANAFADCSALKRVEIDSVSSWILAQFANESASPLNTGADLVVNGEKVTDFVFPEGTTSIGAYAFAGCRSVESVSFPSSLRRVGASAFVNCSGLQQVRIPAMVDWLGIEFSNEKANPLGTGAELYAAGRRITDIVIPTNLKAIGDYTFCGFSDLGELTLSGGVTNVGVSAFAGCTSLTNVVLQGADWMKSGRYKTLVGLFPNSPIASVALGEGWTAVPSSFFSGRTTLRSVSLPASLREIGASAFSGCSGLAAITIPSGVTNVASSAFSGCTALRRVDIASLSEWLGMTFSDEAANPLRNGATLYAGGVQVTELVIPEGTLSIKAYAFSRYTALTRVTFPTDLQAVGANAFSGCTNLKRVDVPSVATWLGIRFANESANPLLNHSGLYVDDSLVRDLVIPKGTTEVPGYAFSGASDITFVSIPTSVTGVGASAFSGCSGITNAVLNGTGWLYAGTSAVTLANLFPAAKLESLTIGEGMEDLPANFFSSSCTSLTSAALPGSLRCIGASAFSSCSKLEAIGIPSGVTNIAASAFSGCTALRRVDIASLSDWLGIEFANEAANPLSTGASLYVNGGLPSHLEIPAGISAIGAYAFVGAAQFTGVAFPDSLRTVATGAFKGCTGVTRVETTSLTSWLGIQFSDTTSNPLIAGSRLFVDDEAIENLLIPDGTTEIGAYAFQNDGFASLDIPNSVTSVALTAFVGCTNLTTVVVAGENLVRQKLMPTLKGTTAWSEETETRLGDKVYKSNVIPRYQSTAVEFKVPKGQTSLIFSWKVGSYQYYDYLGWYLDGSQKGSISGQRGWSTLTNRLDGAEHALKFVYSKDSYTSVQPDCGWVSVHGESLFRLLFADAPVSTLRLVGDVTEIPNGFLEGKSSLTNVVLPGSVTRIGANAFARCPNLKRVDAASMADWVAIEFENAAANPINAGAELYINGEKVTTADIPSGTSYIKSFAFAGWTGLDRVSIPEGLAAVGEDAFSGCVSIRRVDVPSVEDWLGIRFANEAANPLREGAELFIAGRKDADLVIPEGVTEIGPKAFCYGDYASVSIPSSVTNIELSAFVGCTNLTNVVIRGGVETHASAGSTLTRMFPDSPLVRVEVGGGVTKIPNEFFKDCDELQSVAIDSEVQWIGTNAFLGCVNLQRVDVESLDAWRQVEFGNDAADPLYLGLDLYAGGHLATCTVELDANGGEVLPEAISCLIGETVRKFPVPTRADYCYLGWYTDPTNGTQVTEETIMPTDVTIYAHWADKSIFAQPTILAPGHFSASSTQVRISAVEGAEIHYTTDGSVPTRTSPVYSQPFTIPNSTTIRAIATYDPYRESSSASFYSEKISESEEWSERGSSFTLDWSTTASEQELWLWEDSTVQVTATVRMDESYVPYPTSASGQLYLEVYRDSSCVASDSWYWNVFSGSTDMYIFQLDLSRSGYYAPYRFSWRFESYYSSEVRAEISAMRVLTTPTWVTVCFDPDGGTQYADRECRNGEAYGTLPVPVRDEGDEFLGWYDKNGNRVQDTTQVSTYVSRIVLRARWQNIDKTLDPQGRYDLVRDTTGTWTAYSGYASWQSGSNLPSGQAKDIVRYYVDEACCVSMSLSSSKNCESAVVLVDGNPVRSCDGKFDVLGSGRHEVVVRVVGNGGKPSVSVGQISTATLPETVRVSFDGQNGQSYEDAVYTVGGVYGALPVPTARGCEFVGWFAKDGNEVTTETTVSSVIRSLTARWRVTRDFFSEDGRLSFEMNTSGVWSMWYGNSGCYALCEAASGSWPSTETNLVWTTVDGRGSLVCKAYDSDCAVYVDGTMVDLVAVRTTTGETEYVYPISGLGQHQISVVRWYLSANSYSVYPFTWRPLGDTFVVTLDPTIGTLETNQVVCTVGMKYRDIPVPYFQYGEFDGWCQMGEYGWEENPVDMDAEVSFVKTYLRARYRPSGRTIDPQGEFNVSLQDEDWALRTDGGSVSAQWEYSHWGPYSPTPSSEPRVIMTLRSNWEGCLHLPISVSKTDYNNNLSIYLKTANGRSYRLDSTDPYGQGNGEWPGSDYIGFGEEWRIEFYISGLSQYEWEWYNHSLSINIGQLTFEPYYRNYIYFSAGGHGTFQDGTTSKYVEIYDVSRWRDYAPTVYPTNGWAFVDWDYDGEQPYFGQTITALYRLREYPVGEVFTNLVWETSDTNFVKGYWASSNGIDRLPYVVLKSPPNADEWTETVVSSTCRVRFDWKCSCENLFKGKPYDYLSFAIDGSTVDFICGETDWTNVTYEVVGAGEHSLRWTYQKDEETDEGQDCGWLAGVTVLPQRCLRFEGVYGMTGTLPEPIYLYPEDSAVLPFPSECALACHEFVGWSDGATIYPVGYAYPGNSQVMRLCACWQRKDLAGPMVIVPATYDEESVEVTINAASADTIVYYTTDGTDPSTSDTRHRYTAPFSVIGTTCIKAVETREGWFDSPEDVAMTVRSWTSLEDSLGAVGFELATGGERNWIGMREGGVRTSSLGPGWLTATFEGAGIVDWQERSGEGDWETKRETFATEGTHVLRWEGMDIFIRNLVYHPAAFARFLPGEGGEGEPPADICSAEGFEIVLPECGELHQAKHAFGGWQYGMTTNAPGARFVMPADDVDFVAIWEPKVIREAPTIIAPDEYEAESAEVTITGMSGFDIYYTTDGSDPRVSDTREKYAGSFNVVGSVTVKAVSMREDWFDSPVASRAIKRLPWTYGEYLNMPTNEFVLSGDVEWVRVKGLEGTDGYTLKSDVMDDGQCCRISTVVDGCGSIAFKCRVSSEFRKKQVWDGLALYIDSKELRPEDRKVWLGGETGWTNVVVEVTTKGRHVLVWSYEKDSEGYGGEDCAWLDVVAWTPEVQPIVPGEKIVVPEGKAEEKAAEINNDPAVKAQYLKAPGGIETTEKYRDCFNAVATSGTTVEFALSEEGTNQVIEATTAAKTSTLESVLSKTGTLVIGDPLIGFYYSLKQGSDVTVGDKADLNKLAGRDELSFPLTTDKPQYFYQSLVTPTPVPKE